VSVVNAAATAGDCGDYCRHMEHHAADKHQSLTSAAAQHHIVAAIEVAIVWVDSNSSKL